MKIYCRVHRIYGCTVDVENKKLEGGGGTDDVGIAVNTS